MNTTITLVLTWALPPVLGAVIGYVTNAIAIKMLFRPYREWRVFGVRVPLTPGIIPRRRKHLAESIGRMVSDELLTEDAVIRQTSSDRFREKVRESVSAMTEKGLNTSLRFTNTANRENDADPVAEIVRGLVTDLSEGEQFRLLLERLFLEGISRLGTRTIAQIVGDGSKEKIPALTEKLLDWISESETLGGIRRRVEEWTDSVRTKKEPISTLVPQETIATTVGALREVYGPVVDLLIRWLRTDVIHELLERRGKTLLRDILKRLTVLQKFLIAATQYDKQLEENMAGIIDDALEAVESILGEEDTKATLMELIENELETLRSREIDELEALYDFDLRTQAPRIVETLINALSSDAGRALIGEAVNGATASLFERNLVDVIERFSSVESIAKSLSVIVAERVHSLFTAGEKTEKTDGKTIGSFLCIDSSLKARIDEWLSVSAINLIHRRVPAILRSLDLRTLVVEKIDSLDVEQVEGLLMRVIHRHLKWINVFGAILGFIIGMLQIVTKLLS